MALNKTEFQFMLVEALDASKVPFVAGQYIVQDDGKAFYDPSTGTSVDSRIELSTDLSEVLSKKFASKVVTGIAATQTTGTNNYVFSVDVINPETSETSTETFTVTIDVTDTVTEGDKRPVSSDAVISYVDTELDKVKEIAESSSCEIYKVFRTSADEKLEDLLTASYPEATYKKGDIAVLTESIASSKESVTGYIYDGSNWVAMDGNYDASNVFLSTDILLAGSYTTVGNVDKGSAAATKAAGWSGMSVAAILESIFSQILYPSAVTPSVSMTLTNSGAKEIGTTITPTFKVTFDPKKYTYGSVKNSTADTSTYSEPSTVTLTTSENEELTGTMTPSTTGASVTLNLSGASITVDADTSYYGTDVSCVYGDGQIPLTNTGVEYADGKVSGSTATNGTDTSKITGYREGFFYGTSTSVIAAEDITSALIRAGKDTINEVEISSTMKKTSTSYPTSNKTYTMTVPVGAATIIFAWPSNKTGVTDVLNTTVNANMTTSFTDTATIKIAGADNDATSEYAADYTVAVFSPAEAYGSTADLTITLGK